MDLPSLLPAVTAIARSAGERILTVYATDFAVDHKLDRSPVTAADLAAHEEILTGLGRLTPEVPVFSEESTNISVTQRRSWDRYWLVDPLDGTREFVARNGEFTVNIALIEHHQPLLGVVHLPVGGVDYYGGVHTGSYCQRPGAPARRLQVRKPGTAPLCVLGSRSHRSAQTETFLAALPPHEFQAFGSSLKLCLLAEGSADLYPRLGPTSEWDIAAGHAVLAGAGGKVVDPGGAPLQYNCHDGTLNPDFLACAFLDPQWLELLQSSVSAVSARQ